MPARSLGLLSLALFVGSIAVTHAQLRQPVKYVQVTVVDKATGRPVSEGGLVQVLQAGVREPLTQPKINPGTGVVQALLDPGTEYTFHIIAPGYFITNHLYTTPPGEDYEEVPVKAQIEAIPVGKELLGDVLFSPGESTLRESPKLNELVKTLREQPGITVAVVITPDARSAAPVAAPAAAKVKKKKGKRGAAVDTVVAAAPVVTPPPTVDLAAIGQARLNSLREFFKRNSIGLDRIKWDVKQGTMLPYSGGTQQPNVRVAIAGVQQFEIESDN